MLWIQAILLRELKKIQKSDKIGHFLMKNFFILSVISSHGRLLRNNNKACMHALMPRNDGDKTLNH